jgi:pyruvate,water dikinase
MMPDLGKIEVFNRYLVDLSEVTVTELVGGKAGNLAKLIKAGFPVPQGIVLTSRALEDFFDFNALSINSELPQALLTAPLPASIEQALQLALEKLGNYPLAVRSSAQAEDGSRASFAGLYQTVLNIQGYEALEQAVRQCWTSAWAEQVQVYQTGLVEKRPPGLSLLIQRMVPARAAGVAFSANPVTGERGQVVISAVKGLGEKLVSGQSNPGQWVWQAGRIISKNQTEYALSDEEVYTLAQMTQKVEDYFGYPVDLEWALDGDQFYLLQARPITGLPAAVEWHSTLPGGWTRNFRLGEWISGPLTPLFESWLIPGLETRLALHFKELGVSSPPHQHQIINGWYYYSLNFFPETLPGMLRVLAFNLLPAIMRHPLRMAYVLATFAYPRLGVGPYIKDWQEKWLPAYQKVMADGESQLEHLDFVGLLKLVDQVGQAAGDYFFSGLIVGGYAWKSEAELAKLYKSELYPRIGGTYQALLLGLQRGSQSSTTHDVLSLDWFYPTLGEIKGTADDTNFFGSRWEKLVANRQKAEKDCREVLADNPKLARKFEKTLALAQEYAVLREKQFKLFTLGWPLLRRVLHRLGEELIGKGILQNEEEIFFLNYTELKNLADSYSYSSDLRSILKSRRQLWECQGKLNAPLLIGRLSGVAKNIFEKVEHFQSQTELSKTPTIIGQPASPGRITGPVRIIRDHTEFHLLQPGEVLVAPLTTPAWTPLFRLASAVITDTGNVLAHASLVAREYGLPAVVATGEASFSLKNGQLVTVDGTTGVIYLV